MNGVRLSLYGLIFFSVFNFTSPLMGSIYISSDLGGSSEIISYSVAFFGLGNAYSFPLARILGARWGKAPALLFFAILFLATLFLCAWMPTFFLFNAIRFLSGFVCGVFFPLAVALLESINTPKHKISFMAYLAFLVSITPVLGASFGGVVAYMYEWTWIFYLQIPFVCLSIFALRRNISIFKEQTTLAPFDTIGYISYMICTGSWICFTSLGQELDWLRSPLIVTTLVTGLLSTPFFIIWECKHKDPIIDLSLFKIPNFAVSCLSVFFLFSAYFGMVILLAVWLHFDVNYTPNWIALLLLHMLIASICLFFYVLKWIKKVPPFLPVICAVFAFLFSCFYSTQFNAEIDFARIAISRILAGFGLAFFFFPLFTICLDSLPENKKSQGLAVFQSCRLVAGALGVSFYHTLFIRRIVFYHDRLGSQLTLFNQNTKNFFHELSIFHQEGLKKPELLDTALHKQSTALGLADCFYAMGWILTALCVFLILFALKSAKKQKTSPSLQG